MYVKTQGLLCLRDSNSAGAGRQYVACKLSQTNMDRSANFGQLEKVDFFTSNPCGIFGKHIQSSILKPWAMGPSAVARYLASDDPNNCLWKAEGVKLTRNYMQVGLGSIDTCSLDDLAILHLLRGATWPAIQTRVVQTSLCFQNSSPN